MTARPEEVRPRFEPFREGDSYEQLAGLVDQSLATAERSGDFWLVDVPFADPGYCAYLCSDSWHVTAAGAKKTIALVTGALDPLLPGREVLMIGWQSKPNPDTNSQDASMRLRLRALETE